MNDDVAEELRILQLDPADRVALRAWWDVVGRGFLGPAGSDQRFDETAADAAGRRITGVYDASAADPLAPVATVDSWVAPLTVPGGGEVPSWAISAVTVAPTHRRRGLARAMLEAELRAAADARVPLAVLTVSESTIYGRYGFGPATWNADLTIRTRRAGWRGPEAPGRVHIVPREAMLADGPAIAERARRRQPGTIAASGLLATQAFGRGSDDTDLRSRRFLRYDDADGLPQGYAAYRATPNEVESEYSDSRVDVLALVGATDEALAALWRTLLSFDLIGTVVANDRPIDDPVRWLVADPRAVRTTDVRDHLWVRVLDVPAVLAARTWSGPGTVHLEVSDPLGFAGGRWRLEVDAAGAGRVQQGGDGRVALDVGTLGSLVLGGASAEALAAAGRLTGAPQAIADLDRLARTARAPYLGFWF